MLHVSVKVTHPTDRSRTEEIDLLVDTGATFTVLPPKVWEQCHLEAEFTRSLRTADGRILDRRQGLAYVEVNGHRGTVPVIEGGDGDIAVLGVTSLEILGLAFDPVKGELQSSEYLYL